MDILIVDDTRLMRHHLRLVLEKKLGHHIVAEACNGEEAVAMYAIHKPALVILDLYMPVKDGREALQEILEIDPNARVIIFSCVEDNAKVNELLANGATGFIRKPLQLGDASTLATLKDTLAEALED